MIFRSLDFSSAGVDQTSDGIRVKPHSDHTEYRRQPSVVLKEIEAGGSDSRFTESKVAVRPVHYAALAEAMFFQIPQICSGLFLT